MDERKGPGLPLAWIAASALLIGGCHRIVTKARLPPAWPECLEVIDMPTYQLVYLSHATRELDEAEIEALLAQVRAKNQRLGVTGMLLAGDGRFLQVLEGPREVVQYLYDTIKKDDRHAGCFIVLQQEIDAPEFSEWSMGFATMRADELRSLAGFVDVFADHFSVDAFRDGKLARELLLAFRKRVAG